MAFKRVAHLDIKQVYATDANGVFQWREFVKQANENPSQDRSKFLPKEAYKYDTNNFLFLTARAISGGEKWGHNGNYDYFPWEEIKKALPTYPGCGFYIEHKEDSVEDAKGIILDAFADDEQEYVTCLCAIDKNAFPEFCQQLLDGTYNQVSMSCLANECECSECHNVAHSFDELCQHMNPNMPITYMKGKVNDKGEDIYEINRDLCFTGLSSVAVPADKDAFVFDIKASKKKENKLQAELVKYQNIKQAAKMKEFKTACEEQFKSLDTIALLNKLQNCATAITNQVVDQQSDVNILNTPLQGILRQLMELQIGLTVLDLNKLATPSIDNTVAVEGEPETEMPEITTYVEEKDGEGHILTNDELEEVNFDKEIDSMFKPANQSRDQELLYKFSEYMCNLGQEEDWLPETVTLMDYVAWISEHVAESDTKAFWKNTFNLTDEEIEKFDIYIDEDDEINFDKEIDSMLEEPTKGISKLLKNRHFKNEDELESIIKSHMVSAEVLDSDSDGIIVKVLEEDGKHTYKIYLLGNGGPSEAIKVERVEELDSQEANFDKEIESYDNWSYTPFSSTASSNKEVILNALNKSGIAGSISTHGNISHNDNYNVYEDNKGNLIVTAYTRGRHVAENIISLVEPFGYKAIKEDEDILETTVTFEKQASLDEIIEKTYK